MGGGGMPPGAACPWDEAGPVDIECMQISTEARDLLQNGYGILSITTKCENKTHTQAQAQTPTQRQDKTKLFEIATSPHHVWWALVMT